MSESGYSTTMNRDVLAHHGVKGMQWGVWNDDTRRKYLGGSKLKDTEVLPKGLEMKRISNPKDNPMSREYLYTTLFDRDNSMYKNLELPSIENTEMAAIYSMRLSKDVRFADGEKALNAALEDALDAKLSDYVSKTVAKTARNSSELVKETRRELEKWAAELMDKKYDPTIGELLNQRVNGKDSKTRKNAEQLIWYNVALSVGSYSKPKYQAEYRKKMKDRGYDIITDPEDYIDNHSDTMKRVTAPLIVLDPKKSIDAESISKRVMSIEDLDKEAEKEAARYIKAKH